MEVASVQRVLTNLQATQEEYLTALENLSQMLARGPSTRLRMELFRGEVVKPILGLLRCSSHAPTLTAAARVLELTSFGCSQARRRLACMGVVELLLQLLSPGFRRGLGPKVDTGSKEWQSVCEQAMAALRKLSYMCEDIHALLARHSGVGAVINLCRDIRVTELWASFPHECAAKVAELVEGRNLVARAVRLATREKEQLLREFPVLGQLGGGVRESYPAFLVDLADGNNQWVADILVQEGTYWCVLICECRYYR